MSAKVREFKKDPKIKKGNVLKNRVCPSCPQDNCTSYVELKNGEWAYMCATFTKIYNPKNLNNKLKFNDLGKLVDGETQ